MGSSLIASTDNTTLAVKPTVHICIKIHICTTSVFRVINN